MHKEIQDGTHLMVGNLAEFFPDVPKQIIYGGHMTHVFIKMVVTYDAAVIHYG